MARLICFALTSLDGYVAEYRFGGRVVHLGSVTGLVAGVAGTEPR